MTRSSQPTMSTDDASALRRRRPPVVRINLDPAVDASDSAQSSPRAASDSSGAGPTGSPRSESSHGSRSAQSSPRAPSAAGSSPRSFSELRVDIPRGRASPSPEVHTLTKYYQRIGFTSERKAFEQKGLADSYKLGDLLYHTDPVCM